MDTPHRESTTTPNATPNATPSPVLGGLVTKLLHVVINVSDLERSREFYEWATPMRVTKRLSAPLQRFEGLGIEQGEFEGYVLDDGTGGEPTTLHLVEWKTPRPVGTPYETFWNVGYAKLGFATSVPWEERVAELEAGGATITNDTIHRGYVSYFDPDGITLSYFQDVYTTRRHDLWFHTNPVSTDWERSARFWTEMIGLDNYRDVFATDVLPASQGPGADHARWSSHMFAGRGDRRFNIDMTQPEVPEPTPETSKPYAESHHLGIVRVGLEVDDIDLAHELLLAAEPIGQAPGIVCPPEVWDFGPEVGTRRVLSLRDPDGLQVELVQKPERPASSYLRFGPNGAE